MEDVKKVVAVGYDRIGELYDHWAASVRVQERTRYIEFLLNTLPAGSAVLELGCGSGTLVTKKLAERFRVTGVDISSHQIQLARLAVPSATFICADMTSIDFPQATFDAVAAFYSIVHVPRSEHRDLFRWIFGWLRPGGLLLVTLGIGDKTIDFEPEWLGVPMYWSSFDATGAKDVVERAGFRVVSANEETADEDGVSVTFLWISAEKPRSAK
jgi:SAM-dependent methyltransferase